jgi:SHS2 domain-containing protein
VRPGRHRLLPHTADLLVEVRAPDFPSLCGRSVEALFSLLTDRRKVRPAETRSLEFAPDPPEETLLSVLRQSLLLFFLDRFLVRDADATMKGNRVFLTVRGEPMDAERHSMGRELKAVTAHALAVEAGTPGFTARFVVDV